jgi:isopenicillin N synthase-like dioxygenase
MDEYAGAMRKLGDLLLELVARSLDLPDGWFKPFFQSNGGKLRMIKYPPQPQSAQFNQLGAGAHTDWGAVTILAQDDIGGLEVRNVAGEWIQARPIAGAFVINIGDLMARWTNGLYNSNFHRVRNNDTARDRYSIPFFYDVDPTGVIEAIPTCVSPDNPVQYPTCTANEHIADMFQRSYGYRPGQAKAS